MSSTNGHQSFCMVYKGIYLLRHRRLIGDMDGVGSYLCSQLREQANNVLMVVSSCGANRTTSWVENLIDKV